MLEKLAVKPIKEPAWHWKSIAAYIATTLYLVDILLQLFVYHSPWEAAASAFLVALLIPESYFRFAQKRSFLGANFAPVFSIILIVMYVLLYWVSPEG